MLGTICCQCRYIPPLPHKLSFYSVCSRKKSRIRKRLEYRKGRVMKKGMMMTAARYTTCSKRRDGKNWLFSLQKHYCSPLTSFLTCFLILMWCNLGINIIELVFYRCYKPLVPYCAFREYFYYLVTIWPKVVLQKHICQSCKKKDCNFQRYNFIDERNIFVVGAFFFW